jgi:hypothetical protein
MPEDGSLIEPKHVALNNTICIIKLSSADCYLVYHLKTVVAFIVMASR